MLLLKMGGAAHSAISRKQDTNLCCHPTTRSCHEKGSAPYVVGTSTQEASVATGWTPVAGEKLKCCS